MGRRKGLRMATETEGRRAVLLREDDNVAVAARPIPRGFALEVGGRTVAVREPIALGHKVALVDVEVGSPVRKYGQIIGFASRPIPSGSWVHVHNLAADLFERDYAHASEAAPASSAGGRSGATSARMAGSGPGTTWWSSAR